MRHAPAASAAINTVSRRGRRETQRERLLAGVVEAANHEGYARANVSSVIAQAGVSRPTFYEYFTDKEDCFLAALRDIHELLVTLVGDAVAADRPEQAAESAVRALCAFAQSEPAKARFLTNEALSAGQRALDVRQQGIAALAANLEAAHDQLAPASRAPDIASEIVLGAIYRLMSARLRPGGRALSGLLDDVLAWIHSYEASVGEHRWRSLRAYPPPARSPFLPKIAMLPPLPLPPGRPRVSENEVAENHRLRIMFATAKLAAEKGYSATTIADITKRAGLDGRAFYKSFPEKQDAFVAVHELGFQELMAVTAGAFFAGANWPERTWEAGRAFTQFLESNPTIARSGFVEAYAVGPGAVQRVEDSHLAFTIFLREGYQFPGRGQPPSSVALEAIIAAIFEMVHRQARADGKLQLSGLLPNMAHLCLAPFLGSDEANGFIDRQLAER
jgi:AcrR family transcriptional regulator